MKNQEIYLKQNINQTFSKYLYWICNCLIIKPTFLKQEDNPFYKKTFTIEIISEFALNFLLRIFSVKIGNSKKLHGARFAL